MRSLCNRRGQFDRERFLGQHWSVIPQSLLRFWLISGWVVSVGVAHAEEVKDSAKEPATPAAWCAPELTTLPGEVCSYQAAVAKPREGDAGEAASKAGDPATDTLVVFLHGVIQADSGWQYNQQRALLRAAKVNHFDLLAPRGRRGIGPKGMEDWWTWPTRSSAQKTVEPEIFQEWRDARKHLEQARGSSYKRLLIVGFSNGAYYASSLVLRDAFEADGYATLAGGGANYLESTARNIKRRPPVYVGWGLKDKSARKDGAGFAKLLKRLGWPHRSKARPKVGHSMTDAQLAEALVFLRGAG